MDSHVEVCLAATAPNGLSGSADRQQMAIVPLRSRPQDYSYREITNASPERLNATMQTSNLCVYSRQICAAVELRHESRNNAIDQSCSEKTEEALNLREDEK